MSTELGRALFRALARPAPEEPELARVGQILSKHAPEPDDLAADWVKHVASVLDASDEHVSSALADMSLEDVRLAFSCARGDKNAIRLAEASLIEPVPRWLARLSPDAVMVDDVRQSLREKLFVGTDGRPKLLEFRGRGPLAAWVRIMALRLAYERHRATKGADASDEDALSALASAADSPEMAHLREKYAAEFRAAFFEAVSRLTSEERAVLRSHVVDGLTIDQIGALYQVHRATAARWIAHAREVLLTAIHDAFAARLGVDKAACESIVALVRSQIDLSLSRALAASRV